eukprot:3864402-Ditylum_brightwellii.AAC.1
MDRYKSALGMMYHLKDRLQAVDSNMVPVLQEKYKRWSETGNPSSETSPKLLQEETIYLKISSASNIYITLDIFF